MNIQLNAPQIISGITNDEIEKLQKMQIQANFFKFTNYHAILHL